MAVAMKNMLLTLCITGLTGLGMSAAAIDTITLKQEAYVKGPQVTLGEVADITGDHTEQLGGIDVGPAASPGDSRRVEKPLIEARLKTAGIAAETFDLCGAPAVVARTLHLEVTRDVVEQNIRAFVEHQMPWKPEDALIEVSLPIKGMVVPEGEVGFEWKVDPEFRFLGTGGIRGAVTVDGEVKRSFLCKVSIEAYDEVVVASVPIQRGSVLAVSNVTLERRAMSGLKDAVFHDPSELAGFVARRAIGPGEIIAGRSVAPRIIIKRNQLVTVETRAGGLQIETQARAGSDGAVGDVVICVNPNSNQPFQGVVRGDGVVVVE